ncbi:uncharacterized protein BDV17DRAFT_288777 [Aspergillus undulatus]|uniref:uncharacterized protein n=1 Tax=Aspergillus undulatus TaxID=1810928 RepID=UPI003CCCDC99
MNTLVSLILLSVLHLGATAAESCDYNNPTNCINVQAKATRSFEFGDLFPEDATWVYAIDSVADDKQKTAFWLEYPVRHTNNAVLNITQLGMLFTNASGPVEGGNNGCDGLISQECAENLKDVLKWGLLSNLNFQEEQNQSLLNALRELTSNPLRNLSCATDLFDDSALTTTWNSSDGSVARAFVIESTFNETVFVVPESLPSGSASHAYSFPVDRAGSYEAQLDKAGVGITVRAPIYVEPIYDWEAQDYPGERNATFDEIQLDLVCLRAGGDDGSGSNGDDQTDGSQNASRSGDSPGDNSAGRASAFVLPAVLGVLVALVL